MEAHLMEGGSHYRTEGSAVRVEDQHDEKLPSKGPRFGDGRAAVDQEVVSPDSGDTETAYASGGVRGHQSVSSGDGELPGDEDSDDESHLRDDKTFDEGSGSSNRKHPNKGPKVPTCPECGKTFPSDKSLFGHLRCHPERDYRGAIPPPGARKKSQSNAYSSVARGPPVTKWSTPKKGGKGAAVDEDSVVVVAKALLLLADGKPWGQETPTVEKEAPETKQFMNTRFGGTDVLADRSYGNEVISSYNSGSKKRKIKEQANDSGTPTRCRRYQCSICFKTFASHQALGGHIASHNKNKSNVQEAPIAAENGCVHIAPNAVSKAATAEHRCTICNLTFSTGQALGGHMRRHFNELQNQALSSSAHSSESDKGANHRMLQNGAPSSPANSSERYKRAIRGMFDFDLNEVPDL
ncbi:zinc finger protein ZAT9-like [Musa acuminata AAA Group]|uniref:zinc finger protein ZAT9-like n=1 Tax=Musa acuminata AAA Group TaxID=214697 RepID=UPI0031DC1987